MTPDRQPQKEPQDIEDPDWSAHDPEIRDSHSSIPAPAPDEKCNAPEDHCEICDLDCPYIRSRPHTPAPDEKCYIITESQLSQVNTRMKKNPDGEGHGSEYIPMAWYEVMNVLELIRSRPHTPALDEIAERQREWSIVTKEIYEKGKTEGAKAEREKVLVLVDHAMEHCANRSFCMHQIRLIREGKKTAWEEEESLRAQQESTSSREK